MLLLLLLLDRNIVINIDEDAVDDDDDDGKEEERGDAKVCNYARFFSQPRLRFATQKGRFLFLHHKAILDPGLISLTTTHSSCVQIHERYICR